MTRRLLLCLMILMALLTGCGTPVESAEASAAVTEFQIPLYTDATPAVLWGRQQLSAHAQAHGVALSLRSAPPRPRSPTAPSTS